jgi:hypothetical protein
MVGLLENDQRTSRKNIIRDDIEKSLSSEQLGAAATLVAQMMTLETDPEEITTWRHVQAGITQKQQSKRVKIALWVAGGVAVLIFIVANQDNRPAPTKAYNPTYTPPTTPTYTPPSNPPTPAPAQRTAPNPVTSVDGSEERPQAGNGLSLSRSNIRYCEFQGVRLEGMRPLINGQAEVTSFNSLIVDWNSRCSHYRYREIDKSAIDFEVTVRRSALEAEGRSIVMKWRNR